MGRQALACGGAALGVTVAAYLIAGLLSIQGIGRLVFAAMALAGAVAAAAWVDSRRKLRTLAARLEPGFDGADPLAALGRGIDGLLARVRELESALRNAEARAGERIAALERERRPLAATQEIAHVGHWEWDPAGDRLLASDELGRICGLDPGAFPATLAAWLERFHPSERAAARARIDAVVRDARPFAHEQRIERPGGESRDLFVWARPVRDPDGRVTRVEGAAQDITDVRTAERELAARTRDLERSNADLEQFAYAASHDLQEPLRMVASYVQLLARRYRGKLDRDADEFIAFAVDGAERMQKLIRDLLTYSRATRLTRPRDPVDLGHTLRTAMTNLKVAIEDSGASITAEPLPTVTGDATGLTVLVQNLLSNALKFRGARPPNIHVGVERHGEEWRISVRDDGIGFDPGQSNRLFVIFQRLNPPGQFEGSGIGLAICRKIVDRHGGRIWAEPNPAGGATFYFTLPAAAPSARPIGVLAL
jgi:PAS domain S-box-containing protein